MYIFYSDNRRRALAWASLIGIAVLWLFLCWGAYAPTADGLAYAPVRVSSVPNYHSSHSAHTSYTPSVSMASVRHSYSHAAPTVAYSGLASAPVASVSFGHSASMRVHTTSSAPISSFGGGGSGSGAGSAVSGGSSSKGVSAGGGYSGGIAMVMPVSTPRVQTITTAASMVREGRMANDTYAHMSAPVRRVGGILPPEDPHWSCGCVDDGEGHCIYCGCDLSLIEDGHACDCDEPWGYCRCPIGDGWDVWLLLALLAAAYAVYKKRASLI